jgi:hypothetical protein
VGLLLLLRCIGQEAAWMQTTAWDNGALTAAACCCYVLQLQVAAEPPVKVEVLRTKVEITLVKVSSCSSRQYCRSAAVKGPHTVCLQQQQHSEVW